MDLTKKVLLVDDEPDLIELVSYNLKKEGFKVSASLNREDAIEKIRKEPFDLVILDLMLPGVRGVELCRAIRSSPKTESLPIIMLTARREVSDKIRGLESGADDYITKPFSPKELIARVKTVLRRSGGLPKAGQILRIGKLMINRQAYTVTKKIAPST